MRGLCLWCKACCRVCLCVAFAVVAVAVFVALADVRGCNLFMCVCCLRRARHGCCVCLCVLSCVVVFILAGLYICVSCVVCCCDVFAVFRVGPGVYVVPGIRCGVGVCVWVSRCPWRAVFVLLSVCPLCVLVPMAFGVGCDSDGAVGCGVFDVVVVVRVAGVRVDCWVVCVPVLRMRYMGTKVVFVVAGVVLFALDRLCCVVVCAYCMCYSLCVFCDCGVGGCVCVLLFALCWSLYGVRCCHGVHRCVVVAQLAVLVLICVIGSGC